MNSQWLSGFSAPLHALSSLAQLCLSALQTQTRTRTARDPADGLSYTHQACGAALKTGKAHSAIHGANFNAQLRKSQKSCHACYFCPFGDGTFIFHTRDILAATLLLLLWALCSSCCSFLSSIQWLACVVCQRNVLTSAS